MLPTRSSSPPGVVSDSSAPLLRGRSDGDRQQFGRRRPSLRGAAQFLRRVGSRRMMSEPSMMVREAAAEQLEERQSDWAFSKPVMLLDILWNLAFVVVAGGVLVLSCDEAPSLPVRMWVVGYALQCAIHVVCVVVEYRRRHRPVETPVLFYDGGSSSGSSSSETSSSNGGEGEFELGDDNRSVAKHLESANTMFSFIWWIIGFYWVSAGGQELSHEAPQLYWLCIVFLAFDVFFVVFCVTMAFVIGIAVCCCLPCIIAILYAVADQEGASEEDIRQLLKYKFRKITDSGKPDDISGCFGGIMTVCGTNSSSEHVLSPDDAECCICLSAYDDGVELRELPCGHHFHCVCIEKWLYINATCPLCKFNILKNRWRREEV